MIPKPIAILLAAVLVIGCGYSQTTTNNMGSSDAPNTISQPTPSYCQWQDADVQTTQEKRCAKGLYVVGGEVSLRESDDGQRFSVTLHCAPCRPINVGRNTSETGIPR